jgi:hypothetical protein
MKHLVQLHFQLDGLNNSAYVLIILHRKQERETSYAGMNAANDWITLPVLTDPTELNVYVRTSSDPDNWVVTIQSSTSTSGPWTDHGTITENGSGGTISDSYTLVTQNLNLIGNYYVRLFMTSRSSGSAYFDDFIVTCGSSSPAPEINLTGNSTNIIDGDTTPDLQLTIPISVR